MVHSDRYLSSAQSLIFWHNWHLLLNVPYVVLVLVLVRNLKSVETDAFGSFPPVTTSSKTRYQARNNRFKPTWKLGPSPTPLQSPNPTPSRYPESPTTPSSE